MQKFLEVVKQNVKVTVSVAVLGLVATVGWAKGCVVDVKPETPVQVANPSAP